MENNKEQKSAKRHSHQLIYKRLDKNQGAIFQPLYQSLTALDATIDALIAATDEPSLLAASAQVVTAINQLQKAIHELPNIYLVTDVIDLSLTADKTYVLSAEAEQLYLLFSQRLQQACAPLKIQLNSDALNNKKIACINCTARQLFHCLAFSLCKAPGFVAIEAVTPRFVELFPNQFFSNFPYQPNLMQATEQTIHIKLLDAPASQRARAFRFYSKDFQIQQVICRPLEDAIQLGWRRAINHLLPQWELAYKENFYSDKANLAKCEGWSMYQDALQNARRCQITLQILHFLPPPLIAIINDYADNTEDTEAKDKKPPESCRIT